MPVAITSINDLGLDGPALSVGVEGHVDAGLSKLVARWAEKPNVRALLTMVLKQYQEIEEAAWIVIYGRMADYAEGEQLNMLGRIVGEKRNGLGDEPYRTRIKARIAINGSLGRSVDLIAVTRLLTASRFWLTEFGPANFVVTFGAPVEDAAIGSQLPGLLSETRAAGVAGMVVMPVNRTENRNAFFGTIYDPATNEQIGYSSVYDSTVGGFFGHAVRA